MRHGLLIVALAAGCAKAHTAPPDGGGTPDTGVPMPDSCGDMCDADGDGVPDQTDQCAMTPAGEKVNKVGCSDSQLTPVLSTMFPPFGLTWSHGGDPGMAGGLNWTYTGITRGDLFHIWWIVCDDPMTPCGVSLAGSTVGPTEGWSFDATDSDLAHGKLVETNTTHIALADGSMPQLTGRLTVTITDPTQMPIPIAGVGTLHVPARLGMYGAEITGTAFTVVTLIEVQDPTSMAWTPYIDYYNAQPTPTTGGSTAVSFGGSFYSK